MTVTNLTPNAAIVVTALDPYGVSDLFADENGKLYLWLPDGDYTFVAGNAGYTATVDGAGEWSRLVHITLPMIRPVALFVLMAWLTRLALGGWHASENSQD